MARLGLLRIAVLAALLRVALIESSGGEWIMQRYEDGNCDEPYDLAGAQQSWKQLAGYPFCFSITSEIRVTDICRTVCAVEFFCARTSESESGVKMRYFPGSTCLGTSEVVVNFMPVLTWPQIRSLFEGNCTLREKGIYERFGRPLEVGVDVPDCLGYDHSTEGLGNVPVDPKDTPYTLKLFTDEQCTSPYSASMANASGGVSNLPEWDTQVWMNVLRKIDADKRRDSDVHCWDIQSGAPPKTVINALKMKCGIMNDNRMGMFVEHHEDARCGGTPQEEEVFYAKMKFTALSAGQSDVEELKKFFNGECIAFERGGGALLYWKWDRAVWGEDWPDCYALAIEEKILVRRPALTSVQYSGAIGAVRKVDPITSYAPCALVPRRHFVLVAIVWWRGATRSSM